MTAGRLMDIEAMLGPLDTVLDMEKKGRAFAVDADFNLQGQPNSIQEMPGAKACQVRAVDRSWKCAIIYACFAACARTALKLDH